MKRRLPVILAVLMITLFFSGCRVQVVERRLIEESFDIRGLYAADPRHIWAAGTKGNVYLFDGSNWSRCESGTGENLYDVDGSSNEDVWAVGSRGTILHFDGTQWKAWKAPTERDLSGVSVVSEHEVWAVGNGIVLRFDGDRWQDSAVPWNLEGVCAVSDSCVWACGDEGIVHFDGSKWVMQMESGNPVVEVCALDEVNAWAVGSDNYENPISVSTIFRFREGWSPEFRVPDCYLYTVAAIEGGQVIASGSSGVVCKRVNGRWTRSEETTFEGFYAIAGINGDIWLGGYEIGAKWIGWPVIVRMAGGRETKYRLR